MAKRPKSKGTRPVKESGAAAARDEVKAGRERGVLGTCDPEIKDQSVMVAPHDDSGVAQSVERRSVKAEVAGSSPAASSILADATMAALGVATFARKPCHYCDGSGFEPTAIEQWASIEYALRGMVWPEYRIAELRESLEPWEVLGAIRHGSVDVKKPDGSVRTFTRWEK